MNFTVLRSTFQRAFSLVNHAVVRGAPPFPLLAYVRLEIEESLQRVKLQASNLEMSLTAFAPVEEADEPAVIAVPARLLTELLATLEEGRLAFAIDLDVWNVTVTHAAGQASFMGLSPEQYPPIPEAGSEGVQVFGGELAKAIREVSIAVAHDDRQIFTCLLLQGGAERLTLAAADGRRVSYRRTLLPPGADTTPLGNLLVPCRALGELASILPPDMLVMVSVNSNRSQVLFSTASFVFSAILLSGEFPNYLAVIPTERPLHVEVKTDDFLRIVRAARIFTNGANLTAQLSMRPTKGLVPGTLTISARSDVGSNSATIPALVRGEETDVTFNITLLWEALQAIGTPDVTLEIGQATAAKVAAPAGVLMPVGGGESVHAFMSVKA